jgi:hypothetical protein
MFLSLLIAVAFASEPDLAADDPPETEPVEVLMPVEIIEELEDLEERLDKRDAEISDLTIMAAELMRLVAESKGVELPPVMPYQPTDTGEEVAP